MRKQLLIVGAFASSLLLSGCGLLPWSLTAQVPTSSSVQEGNASGANSDDQFIRVIPQAPRRNMTASQLVQGFLDASAASESDHSVARMYLTSEAAAAWEPKSGVQVFKGTPELTSVGTTVVFNAQLEGQISKSGNYSINQDGKQLNAKFSLIRDNGEWRISALPQGLELSTVDVQRAYRDLSVYFFNPQFSTLVPDSRMIAVPGDGLAAGLMQALLAGPSEWLAPAVKDAFPFGVGLNFNRVPIENGVATVDLTADATFASDAARREMAQQIVWTLRQVPEIRAVTITAGGQALSVQGVPNPIPRDQWPEIDPSGLAQGTQAIVAKWTGVYQLTRIGTSRLAGVPPVANSAFTQVVTNKSSGMLAGLDVLGRVWSTPLDSNPTWSKLPITQAIQWIEFDPLGGLWMRDISGGLLVWDAPGPLKSIRTIGLGAGASVLKAVPSRDGTRAALIVQRGKTSMLYLARIEQAVDTGKRTLTGPIRIAGSVGAVIDVDWSSANSLAFIGRNGPGALQAFDVDLALGTLVPQGGPDKPDAIAAAPGLPVLVSAKDGLIYQFDAGAWSSRLNAWSPSYPS